MFALGYIAGVVTCCFAFLVIVATDARRLVARAENSVRETAKKVDDKVGHVLPIPRGFVETPPDDDELARQEIIEQNKAEGRDTHISELQP